MNTSPSRPATDLLQTLGEAFETFEAIRHLARSCEDQAPDLFAAFMSAAVAAADGRDAVLTVAAPPASTPNTSTPGGPVPGADPHEVADAIAGSAAALAIRLDRAAELAEVSQYRRACQDAAVAARQIHQLLARR